MTEDLRATALVDQLNALEARLKEPPRTLRAVIWRAVSYSIAAFSLAMMDLSITHPLVLGAFAVFGFEYFVPFFLRRRLNREREKLIAQHDRIIGMTQPGLERPESSAALDALRTGDPDGP